MPLDPPTPTHTPRRRARESMRQPTPFWGTYIQHTDFQRERERKKISQLPERDRLHIHRIRCTTTPLAPLESQCSPEQAKCRHDSWLHVGFVICLCAGVCGHLLISCTVLHVCVYTSIIFFFSLLRTGRALVLYLHVTADESLPYCAHISVPLGLFCHPPRRLAVRPGAYCSFVGSRLFAHRPLVHHPLILSARPHMFLHLFTAPTLDVRLYKSVDQG